MDINSAVTLSNGSSYSSALLSGDQVGTFKLSLIANADYTLSVNSASFDSVMKIYDGAGNFLTIIDSQYAGGSESVTFSPTISGDYYVEVSGYLGDFGAYDINLTSIALPNTAPTHTGTSTVFSTVTVGQTIVITEQQLLVGWSDAEGDALHVQNLHTSNGTLTDNGNGTWAFKANATGPATLTYDITDGNLSTTAQNSITAAAAATPTISITKIDGETSEDGDTAQIQVSLNVAPTGAFSVTLTASDLTEAGFVDAAGLLSATKTISFNASNWNAPQIVTLKGIQDYDNDRDVTYSVTGRATNDFTSPAANYASQIRDLSVNLTFINKGDVTALGADRDVPVYLVGDDGRPQEDLLMGNDGSDRLYGGYMIDELHGGIGGDRLYGGYEDDFIYGDSGNDQLYGESDDDYLNGGAGNDRMDGGIGADTLVGGDGNDTYYVTLSDEGNVEDTVVEVTAATGGSDTIYIPFQVENYVAPTGVEIVKMNAGFGNTSLTGNGSSNGLYGNAGNNVLGGGAGNDTLSGGSGTDTLVGGTGIDSLIGGAGNDTFDINLITEVGTTLATADVIADFQAGDLLDLATLDANVNLGGNQAFTFISGTTFSSAGQVFFSNGYLYGNNDSDAAAEFIIKFAGVTSLSANAIIL